jgi:hypothetical protein
LPAQKVTDPPNEISSFDATDEEIKPPVFPATRSKGSMGLGVSGDRQTAAEAS